MSAVVERFLAALEARDYDAIAGCFAPGATLRALLPSRVREESGPDEIAARYRFWLDQFDEYEVAVERAPMHDREQLRYRCRGVTADDGPSVMEQQGYAVVDGDTITSLDLVCSGFRPL